MSNSSAPSRPQWDPPAVEFVDYSWRRLFAGDARNRAKTIPLREIETPSQVPTETRTSMDAVAIAQENQPVARLSPDGSPVHSARAQYRPATPERAAALRLLRSVPAPLTIVRVARALVWTEARAKGWLYEFQAKGLLVKNGRVYTWTGK